MATLLPRLQLFEFEDFSWFPATIRDLMTDFLRQSTIRMGLHRPMVALLQEALGRTRTPAIVDLCSGGGGLLVEIQNELASDPASPIAVTFTDKYPNAPALAAICASNPERLSFERQSVDATAVPSHLRGIRTLFSAFHHFSPDVATRILGDAVRTRQGIAVFEVSRRSLAGLVPMLLSPIATLLLTPFIRPLTFRRLFFTYVIPAVPFFVMWDGIVSAFRTYDPDELREMVGRLGATDFRWDIGKISAPLGYKITYIIGVPA